MEVGIGLLGALAITLSLIAIIFFFTVIMKQKEIGPSVIRSPLGIEFQPDLEGYFSNLIISNPTEEPVEEIKIVVYIDNQKREYTIRDIKIKPHQVQVIDLGKEGRVNKEDIKKAWMIEVYYKGELVGRRLIEK